MFLLGNSVDGWPSLTAVGNIVRGMVLWGRVGCWSCLGRCRVAGRAKENAKQNVQGGGLQTVDSAGTLKEGPDIGSKLQFDFCSWEPPRIKSLSCP